MNGSNDNKMSKNQSPVLKNPRIGSSRHSTSKFGFSTQQYKKLQIIKAARQINLKLLVSINRLKYNKFYMVVLQAFNELVEIVHQKPHLDIIDWQSMIMHVYRNQSKLILDINEVANLVESGEFEKQKVIESRQIYFGSTPSETSLYKHCTGSKEIRVLLQFNFSVYNYIKDLRKKVKPRKVQQQNSVQSSATKSNKSNK